MLLFKPPVRVNHCEEALERANRCIREWDSQRDEVEMYDKRGKHMGAFDPNTGEPIPGKEACPTRKVEP
ncbi:hypothetical protein EFP18_12705 [Burkholderia glumae]|uniref:colicin E3/pyocin S6 family cytotoxin n=1 Tax=Burkholderia glumae TaxID=337 RepID=UPI0009B79068|nr:hypothetical protein [Burkholderia glumae]PJO20267.1 hypothetical protein Y5A_025750 [Burkholderia glumae AU6208]QHE09355.1 hypothetical protein GQR88_02415 [Burkholderia glumae AU6208]QHP89610.1 hypothetical protein EXE55_00700 [Burkholderia glumae]QJW77383.1 hypothetical protein GAS18_00380 [Burkholderia glumae]